MCSPEKSFVKNTMLENIHALADAETSAHYEPSEPIPLTGVSNFMDSAEKRKNPNKEFNTLDFSTGA